MSKKRISPTFVPPLRANKPLILDIDDLCFKYSQEQILDDISFCVHEAEFIGLIGPNGAGKTTLLEIILGLIKPTTGAVKWSDNLKVGYVPQSRGSYTSTVPVSVLEVVMLGARGNKHAAADALKEVGMFDYASKNFKHLSGGQMQRVFIAKALASQAKLLILDEPVSGVDERTQVEFYDVLQKLQKMGMTIIMVSHEVDVVLKLVNRVIYINKTIIFDGDPDEFNPEEYLTTDYKLKHIMLHHGPNKL